MDLYSTVPLAQGFPSIRLAELQPDSDMRLKLQTHRFEAETDYDALSYHWGDHKDLVAMPINEYNCFVTKNLREALHHFHYLSPCHEFGTRKLWIDAIGINQGDKAEKTLQLPLMRAIFAGAKNVMLWLGKSDHLTALVFETLERFAAAADHEDEDRVVCEMMDTGTGDERKSAIQEFLKRSYFDRVWIIQEIIVAQNATIVCGDFSMAFEDFITACQRMTGSGFLPYSTSAIGKVTYLGDWRREFHGESIGLRKHTFDINIFIDFRDKFATDRRDKVYALIGLANNTIYEGTTVDYEASVERIYTDFAKHLVTAQQGLRVLSAVVLGHRRTSSLQLPSWVPDWSQPQLGGGILQKYYRFQNAAFFKAGGLAPVYRNPGMEDAKSICLKGVCFDVVDRIIPIRSLLFGMEPDITEATIRQLANGTALPNVYSLTGEALWVAYFRTLTADRSFMSSRIRESYRANFLWRSYDMASHCSNSERLENLPRQAWDEIGKIVHGIISDKIMFVTSKGYLGLGQEGSKTGDTVCVFPGGETPFILRLISVSPTKRYQLLGECYVHGIMDGELFENSQSLRLDDVLIE